MIQVYSSNANKALDDPWSESDDEFSEPRQSISHEAMMKLNEMRENNQLCDVAIYTENGSVFNAHRPILCACSDYFKTLFTTDLNKNKSETLVVGISPEALQLIIKFAYLRDVSGINETNVEEMLKVTDYFAVNGLMKYCIDFMLKSLSSENCTIFWLLGRHLCVNRLMIKSRNFILQHFIGIALECKDLLELNFEDFHDIMDDEMLNVKDEYVVWECIVKWIDFSPEERKKHLTRLMRACRMGLLPNEYFMEKVKRNQYVIENEQETRPIILEVMRFLCDLETISNSEMNTPLIAIPRLPHEVIFAIGGWSEGAPQSVIESYDTRADRWNRIYFEDPAGPRSYHGTAVLGTKLYCIGGFNGTEYFNTCSLFDVVKKTWREIAPMHCRRCYVSVAALDGKVYALGGYDGTSRQNTGERYCPKTNQWTIIQHMNFQRSDADACAMNGKIFITGGFNGQECLNTAEFYNPITNTWTLLPPMLSRRSGVSCVSHKGFLYVIGGFNGLSRMNTGERFDFNQQIWINIKEMYHPRSNFGLEIIDDLILAIGGFNGVVTISHCECYDTVRNEWLEATDMSVIRSALTANVVTGIPNIKDYVHQERHKLLEERRLKMFGINSSEISFDLSEVSEQEDSNSMGSNVELVQMEQVADEENTETEDEET